MSQVIKGSNHSDFTIKLKIVVDEYIICLILNKSSRVTTDNFKVKKPNLVPVTLTEISTTSNGTKLYNSYRGSLMENVPSSIAFKMDENPLLDTTDLKNKEQFEYIATG